MRSRTDAVERIRDELGKGELCAAYDLAEKTLRERPDDLRVRHLAVLTLARAGALEQASRRFDALLAGAGRSGAPRALKTDIASLGGRLKKDAALLEPNPVERRRLFREAAKTYLDVYRATRDWYPGINGATLSLLAGNDAVASRVAVEVLRSCARHRPKSETDAYYLEATRAEAALVLGHREEAAAALEKATRLDGSNFGARAGTRRQLRLVCWKKRIPKRFVDTLRMPRVIHFASSRRASPPSRAAVAELRAAVDAYLASADVGFGYGSLCSWVDVVVAERLRARRAEFRVVLPFAADELRRLIFAPLGADWARRFRSCLDGASGHPLVMAEEYLDDDHVFTYAREVAMGIAALRSQFLTTEARQLAIGYVDGDSRSVYPQTSSGLVPRDAIATGIKASRPGTGRRKKHARRIAAMLFGDVKGFSKLRESQIPAFVHQVLGAFASTLRRYDGHVLYNNTWGDGLYVVVRDIANAARLATDLQARMRKLRPLAHGLPEDMSLRLGGHAGPVYEMRDPVLARRSFMGSHVSRTARIEPVTPPGQVYVSEPFAAAVALQPNLGFACEYVGHVEAAKGYGSMRMYALKRRGLSAD